MNLKLANADFVHTHTIVKQSINRVNNNPMYQPNIRIYNDHYVQGLLDQKIKQGDFYSHLEIGDSLIAGNFYRPKSSILKSIRQGIDQKESKLRASLI